MKPTFKIFTKLRITYGGEGIGIQNTKLGRTPLATSGGKERQLYLQTSNHET